MASDKETTEPRYYGLEIGTVIANNDPRKASRVRVNVPGIAEDTGWALPLGAPGAGSAQRGLVDVPPKGSEVGIFFHRGDPHGQAYWLPAHWGIVNGKSEMPSPFADDDVAPDDAQSVKAYETKRWLLTFDERPGKEMLRFADKVTGDKIEFDAHALAISLEATSAVKIKATGQVSIEGTDITIGGRKVLQNGKPIQ